MCFLYFNHQLIVDSFAKHYIVRETGCTLKYSDKTLRAGRGDEKKHVCLVNI